MGSANKDNIPPHFVKLLRRFLKLVGRSVDSQLVFRNYNDALNACRGSGYQDKKIIDVVIAKNLINSANISSSRNLDLNNLRTLIAISALPSMTSLNVVDFGVGGGESLLSCSCGPWRTI